MRSVVLILLLVLHGLFAVLNSTALMYPQDINLGPLHFMGPLGLLAVVASALISVLAFIWLSVSSLRQEAKSARLLQELEALRQRVSAQNESEIREMQRSLEERLSGLERQIKALSSADITIWPPDPKS